MLFGELSVVMGQPQSARAVAVKTTRLLELDRAIKDFHHYLGWRLFDHELAEAWQDKAETELRGASDGG